MKRLLPAIAFLISIGAAAQTVNLLKDINAITNASGSSPSNFTNVGGVIFFTATDPERGTELWKTNGTSIGTVVVKDINPGSNSSSPSYLTAIGSTVYFSANDGVNGSELWKSDGTDVGTVIVKDIYAGTGNSSFPQYIIAAGTTLYFSATNGTNGYEVWKSDGTTLNTVQLADIAPASANAYPAYFTYADGIVYFQATNATYGAELWRTIGGPPTLVKDIYPGTTGSNPYNITTFVVGTTCDIAFSAYTATNGQELWKSDGSSIGTAVVDIYYTLATIFPTVTYDYTGSSSPDYLVSNGSYIYMAATSSSYGREIYRFDGSTATLFKDEVASGDLSPQNLTNASGTIYFSGINAGDRELYKATGSSTITLIPINASGSSSPSDFEAAGSSIYFSATHATNGKEFYTYNGTTLTWLADINPGTPSSNPANKAYLGGVVYLSATRDSDGTELWLYNGSTSLLKDINGGSEDGNPGTILNTGSTLYFSATTSTTGVELWKSDGTNVGTVAVADILAGSSSSYAFPFAFSSSLVHLSAYTTTKGYEFYVSTGAVGNFTLREVNTVDESGSSPASNGYVTLGTDVYFTAYTAAAGTELYKSSGGATASLIGGGTGLYSGTGSSYPYELTVFGSFVYFSATDDADGNELYRTSGSSIQLVSQLNLGTASSYPYGMCVSNGKLFWAADNGSDGVELFYTTSTGATKVKPAGINAGSNSSNPQNMTDVNGTLFFRAIDGTNGSELWKSDGTDAGTVIVKDINTVANTGSSPNNLTAVGSVLYFTANEATYGTELYKSDGSNAGTVMVKDIFTGTSSSSPAVLKNVNGTLYFRASNGTGLNLMKTNGTSAGTVVATSSGGSVTYQGVSDINYLNQNVYWVGTTNTYGKEMLYVKAEPLSQPTSLVINGATQSTLNLSWTAAAGSPAGYIVVRHNAGTPTGLPVDGAAPALNTPLVSGTGTVAYVGISTSFTDTGLTPGTTYYYAVYSYNNGGSSVNIYKPHTPLTGNSFTLAANPTVQATSVTFSNVLQNSITVNWSNGNGSERLVLARSLIANSDVPVDGTAYTGNSNFATSTLLVNSKIVYRGSGSSVNVTNLATGTLYHFTVIELNGTTTQTNYLTSVAGATSSTTTLALDGNQPTNLVFSSIGTNTISLNWTGATAGATTGYIVMRKATSDPTDLPSGALNVGDPVGSSTVVYNANNLTTGFINGSIPTMPSAGTVYYYRVYAKTAPTTYVTGGPLTGSQTTLATDPTGAPGPITLSPTTTSLAGNFSAGTGAGTLNYIVLQRQLGVVSDVPVDGVTYVVDNTIGIDSKVVYVGTGLSFTSSGLASNTIYYYAAFTATGSGASINYLTSSWSAASRATLVDEPTEQPSTFVFSNLAPNAMDVSFSDAPTVPDGYLVLRSTGSAVADAPDDGLAYNVNDVIGAATVVSVGNGTSFSQSGLTAGLTYHYAAISYNGSGQTTNYLVTSAATGSQVTPASEPSAQPTAVNFTSRSITSLSFSFSAAAGTPAGYLVLRSSGAAPTATPLDAVAYSAGGFIGGDVVVQVGPTTTVVDDNFTAGLVEDTQYFYAIFSYNGTTGTYNYLATTPLQGSAFTLADEPVEHPINMVFSLPTTTSMTVAFDEPVSLPAGYLVLRRAGAASTGIPVDGTVYVAGNTIGNGTVVHVGSTPSFSSTGLTASTVYHYTVYPYKGNGVSSNFLVTASTTPLPVLTSSRTTLQSEPAGQPTALLFSNITTSTASVGLTASDANQYLVIRRAGSPPTETPDDGIVYPINDPLGTSIITFKGSGASFPFVDGDVGTAPMAAGTTYHYAIYGFNGAAGANNYLLSSPLTGSVDILALQPTFQPTVLTFSNVTSSTLAGSFTSAVGSPTGYLVIRRQGAAPTGTPSPATPYSAGNALGNGTIVYVGTGSGFIDTGLSAETPYYYTVFSFNGSGGSINYLTTSPLGNNITTLDSEPSQPTGIGAGRAETSLQVGFTPSDAEQYLILRKAGSAPTEVPVDGTGYVTGNALGASTIVLAGTATIPITDTGLTSATVYHYAIFGYNGSGAATYNYNPVSPLTGSFSTLSSEPGTVPSGINFTNITASSVTLSFNPASGSPTGYIVLRRQGAAPTSDPIDGAAYADGAAIGGGTVVQTGSALFANETGLSAETSYFYRVYSYNGSGGSINYLTSTFLSGSVTMLDTAPTQPTAFSSGSITTNTISISMSLSGADHYLILRKTGSTPTEVPVDGTGYITGGALGTSTIVLAGDISALPVNDTGLSSGTVYYYAIYAYNGAAAATYNYNTVSPLVGNAGTMAAQPSTQPTSMVFSAVTSSTTTVTFTAATSSPAGYLVIRRQGQAPSSGPVDGTDYNPGDALGGGDVVSVGAGLTFNDSGLSPETAYFYQAYAFNGSGATANFLSTSPLSNSITTLDTEPAQPTVFATSNITTTGISIGMTLSVAEHFLILRKAGSAPTDLPVDGTGYTTGNALGLSTIVLAGDISSLPINDTGLSPGIVYHYAIYAYNGAGAATYNYNTVSPLVGSAGTLAAQPSLQPTVLAFSNVTDASATVSFNAAIGSPAGYLVIRREGLAPSGGPSDGTGYSAGDPLGQGTVISVGPAISIGESGLSTETTYFYQVYAFNGSGSTSNYLTSSPLSGSFTTLDTEPAQPTAFSASNITTSAISISMTLSGANHYLILRKAGSAPTEVPVDRAAYLTGDMFGTSSIVLSGDISALPIIDAGLSAGTVYFYAIYAFNGSATLTYNYNTASPLTGSVGTLAAEPSIQPTLLGFSSISSSSATVTFTAAAGLPTGYLVLRRDGQLPSAAPVDATTYSVNDLIGGGVVVSIGTSLSINDSGLTSETTYHYQVFAFNGSSSTINYLTSAPLSNNFTTLATEPSQPTAFTSASAGTNSVSIGFSTSGAQHYLILRKAGSSPTELPADGVGYVAGDMLGTSDIVRAGTIASLPISDASLAAATVYHYTIYAYNGTTTATNNYNTVAPLLGSVGTLDSEPLGPPSALTFSAVAASSMTVAFTAASGSPDGYFVIRRANTAPSASPVDGTAYTVGNSLGGGTIVHIGSAVTFNESGLSTETPYFYSIYSFNGGGLTSNYFTSSALTGNRTTLATEPLQATAFVASNMGTSTLSINFTESDAQHYLILRRAANAPTENPVDGVGYTTGLSLGASTIVLAGDITTLPINESGLIPGTVYHYKIFGYNGSSAATFNYNTVAPLTGVTGTLSADPIGQPLSVTFDEITSSGATVVYPQATGSPAGYLLIRRQDAAPTGAPVDGTPYNVGDALGGGFVAYVGTDLSFGESGLTAAKTYHYRVFSYNGGAQTINYLTTSPGAGSFTTLATEPTTQPSSIEFDDILASSFTVSFTGATTTPSGYIAVRKANTDPSGLPADGTPYNVGDVLGDGIVAFVGSATTFNEQSLTLAAYHYAIYSFNGSGVSINYKTDNPPKNTLPVDASGPVLTNNTGSSLVFNANLVVKYTITDAESGINTAAPILFYRPLTTASTDAFSQKSMALNGATYEATLTPADIGGLGLDFYVTALNGVGVPTTSPTERLRVAFSGSTNLPELTGGATFSKFHIVAVPLELTNNSADKVFESLNSRDNGTEWRLFRWNPSTEKTEEFKTLNGLDIEPGKGYWLITSTSITIAPGAGSVVPATEQQPFEMDLSSGWNQIGNPYLFNLWWDDIRDANPLAGSLPLRLFNGNENAPFTNGDILPVFTGGFTQVGPATSISIPTEKNPDAGRESARRPKTHALDSDDWEVIVNLQRGAIVNPFGGVGMSRDASESYDRFDDFSLPRFMDYAEINYPKKAYGMVYTKDIIPLEENHIWEFSVDASSEGVTQLTWDNTYFGTNDRHIMLWDEEEQLATDMRKENSYSFVLQAGRKFKIFFGNKEFVEEQSEANTVRIHSVSPNPTHADVSVEFSIPGQERSHVNVHVLNNMGQPIATVFDGEMEAGHHTMQWAGTDFNGLHPAAGVYLVEVINGDSRTSKRLVIK